nr:transposase, MuDR [Ipomoea batatas]
MLDDGEEDSVFTIKLHLGGDMIFKPRFSYKNGLVEYFDHFNCDEGSILDLRRMVKQLRFCDKKAQFWYQYGNPRRPKLMKLSSDADILGLITDIPVNKELDIYVEHLYDDQWDYDVEISRELGDDTLLHDDVFSEDESRGSDSVGEQDDEKNNLRDTATSSKPKGGLEEQAEDFVEVECNMSEQILRSLCDSDSEGAAQGPLNVFEERNL